MNGSCSGFWRVDIFLNLLHHKPKDIETMDKKPIFALRLKQARLRARLTVAETCKALGISRQSYTSYEQGVSMPGSQRLLKLQGFFHLTAEELMRESHVAVSRLDFRKSYKFNKHDQEYVAERIRDAMERRLETEGDLGIEARPRLPKRMTASSTADACRAAQAARAAWGIGSQPIMNMGRLLENMGIMVVMLRAGEGFDGVSGTETSTGRPFVALNTAVEPCERRRLTAGHELGHLCMDAVGEAKCREAMCHSFANELLLPSEVLSQFFEPGKPLLVSVLKDLQRTYGISIRAIIVKLHELGIFSDAAYRRFWVRLSKERQLREMLDRTEFSEEPVDAYGDLVRLAVKEHAYSPEYAARLLGVGTDELKAKEPKYV